MASPLKATRGASEEPWGHVPAPLPVPQGALPAETPQSRLDRPPPPALSSRLQRPREASPGLRAGWGAPLRRSRHREPPGGDRRQHLLCAGTHHGPAVREGRGGGGVPQEAAGLQGEAGGRPVWGGEWAPTPGLGCPEAGAEPKCPDREQCIPSNVDAPLGVSSMCLPAPQPRTFPLRTRCWVHLIFAKFRGFPRSPND